MTAPSKTFLNLPARLQPHDELRAAIFGVGHGTIYPGRDGGGHALAADAIRAASQEDASLVEHWDFDLGGLLFEGGPVSCIDVGDVETVMGDGAGNRARIERKTRELLTQGAVPIMIGGDDSVPIPFLAAFAGHGPIWVLQIDAHIDWRDEVDGERYGYSSPMRRASEMAHVAGIVQVGIRSVGSAGLTEVDAARAYGSRIVTAREVHNQGVEAALRHLPEGARVVVTLDCDGLDPSIMPGVAARTPGGLGYTQTIDLIAGAARRGRIVGMDLVELLPTADLDGLSALTASRILVNAIANIVRQR
ncbi:agmatinase [Aureimonas altamirensis]|uniref:agmatinase n=1 Tax=Aureimonas altamirensis TaxID=370622 RepID=UPI001E336A59|nr:agmatinase [Aureimonas altamirensis]UHD45781.1 agmatinase [Aureimonas altamirensis]